MPDKVAKAYAINDARIMFVSLVGKAANKHQFLITKSEDGKADFQTYGRILKADAGSHFVTGIVYEPMVEDTDGNYMTEEEITKAAHWFAKNGNKVDLQHSFEPLDGAVVVESSVTKCDMELEGQTIRKGTWLMTVEIQDEEIYKAIEKGEITGFSMGGSGVYSEVDVDITASDELVEKGKAKGIFKQFARLFGLEVVEKGKVKETFKRTSVRDNFWNAYYALSECLLDVYNPETERWEFQHDEGAIREALEDFNEIITELLVSDKGIFKTASIAKSGKAMSSKNKETLKGIYDNLGAFLSNFNEENGKEEGTDVTKQEVEQIVEEAIAKAMKPAEPAPAQKGVQVSAEPVKKEEKPDGQKEDIGTLIEKAVGAAVAKAFGEDTEPEEEPEPGEKMEDLIEKAVAKAMEPYLNQAGISKQLNGEGIKKADEEEQHYLHGII